MSKRTAGVGAAEESPRRGDPCGRPAGGAHQRDMQGDRPCGGLLQGTGRHFVRNVQIKCEIKFLIRAKRAL